MIMGVEDTLGVNLKTSHHGGGAGAHVAGVGTEGRRRVQSTGSVAERVGAVIRDAMLELLTVWWPTPRGHGSGPSSWSAQRSFTVLYGRKPFTVQL